MRLSLRTPLTMSACILLGFGSAMMLGFGTPGPDPEKGQVVALDAVPAAVKKSVEFHAPGATISHAWKVMENDTTVYILKGRAKDADRVEFKALESGRLVEVMHDMAVDKLPADVVEQVKALVPKGTILVGERHSAIRWRIEVKDGDKIKEVVLRADGKHAIFDKPVTPPTPAPPATTPAKPAGK
jgi:hypothetical protein